MKLFALSLALCVRASFSADAAADLQKKFVGSWKLLIKCFNDRATPKRRWLASAIIATAAHSGTHVMRAVVRRIDRLEDQFGSAMGKPGILLVVSSAGWGLALDEDRCIEILRECGSLPTGPIGLVNLCQIPDGLNAEETERFLRENWAEICGREQSRPSAHAV
jgi:hypothetical protein